MLVLGPAPELELELELELVLGPALESALAIVTGIDSDSVLHSDHYCASSSLAVILVDLAFAWIVGVAAIEVVVQAVAVAVAGE